MQDKYTQPSHIVYKCKYDNAPEVKLISKFSGNYDTDRLTVSDIICKARLYAFAYYIWYNRNDLVALCKNATQAFTQCYTTSYYLLEHIDRDGNELLYNKRLLVTKKRYSDTLARIFGGMVDINYTTNDIFGDFHLWNDSLTLHDYISDGYIDAQHKLHLITCSKNICTYIFEQIPSYGNNDDVAVININSTPSLNILLNFINSSEYPRYPQNLTTTKGNGHTMEVHKPIINEVNFDTIDYIMRKVIKDEYPEVTNDSMLNIITNVIKHITIKEIENEKDRITDISKRLYSELSERYPLEFTVIDQRVLNDDNSISRKILVSLDMEQYEYPMQYTHKLFEHVCDDVIINGSKIVNDIIDTLVKHTETLIYYDPSKSGVVFVGGLGSIESCPLCKMNYKSINNHTHTCSNNQMEDVNDFPN